MVVEHLSDPDGILREIHGPEVRWPLRLSHAKLPQFQDLSVVATAAVCKKPFDSVF
jgi:hypothetical protein